MLYPNDIIFTPKLQARARVIHLDFSQNEAWLFNLAGTNSLPKMEYLDALMAEVSDKQLMVEQTLAPPITLTPSAAAKAAQKQAYALIKPLVETPDILHPPQRNALINQRALETGASPRTLLKHLRAWWANGLCPDALLPAFHKRGSTGGDTANRGRPPKYEDRLIYQLTATDNEQIQRVFKKYYLEGDIRTLADTHQKLLELYFTRTDSEGRKYFLPPGEMPSYMQFRRVALAAFPREFVIRKRKGDAEYELNHRPVLGSLHAETYTVGDVFEIDATIADLFVVSSKNRAKIIGKPTLYLIVDRRSWLIAGFYVGLESASWAAAMQAILSISEDKEAMCKRYGVTYSPNDWPAHGIFPKEFVADRGEMLSENSTAVCEGLAVTVRNLPKKRADHKPFVECSFKLVHQPIAAVTPGYEPPKNVTKRQGKHYEQDACLTLDEFTNVVLQAIIRHNRSPRDVNRLSAEQVLDGNILPIPVDIWNIEVRQRAGALPRISEQRVRFSLLPKGEATVSREGIFLDGCYYGCTEAMARGWHDIAAQKGNFKVSVSFDKRLVDTIYIHDGKSPSGYFEAALLDKCSDFRGLSFPEVEAIEHFRKRLSRTGKQVTRQQTLEFNQAVEPMAQKALLEAKAASKGKSRTARKKDIVHDREEELRRERQARGAAAHPSVTEPTAAKIIPLPVATTYTTNPATESPATRRQQILSDMINGC